jgi:hypothetical protein
MTRVLAFTCSRDRPYFLRHCILQMRGQTYRTDHSVFINDSCDAREFHRDLAAPSLFLHYGQTGTQHENYTAAIQNMPWHDYDLFCKIDDDDVYYSDYIESVVADFTANAWDYSGSCSDGVIDRNRWLPHERWQSLGMSDKDRELGVIEVMPCSMAFSRRGIECILALNDPANRATIEWPTGFYEDIGWRRAVAANGLKQHVRGNARFAYHVHATNTTAVRLLHPAAAHGGG